MERHDLLKKIGLKVAQTRKGKRISQEDLADRANKAVNTISDIERGITDARISTFQEIADSLGIKLIELLDIEDMPTKPFKKSQNPVLHSIIQTLHTLDDKALKIAQKQIEALKYLGK